MHYQEEILNEFVEYVNVYSVALGLEELIDSHVVTEDEEGLFLNIEVHTAMTDEEIAMTFKAMGYDDLNVRVTNRDYFDKEHPEYHEITIRISGLAIDN